MRETAEMMIGLGLFGLIVTPFTYGPSSLIDLLQCEFVPAVMVVAGWLLGEIHGSRRDHGRRIVRRLR